SEDSQDTEEGEGEVTATAEATEAEPTTDGETDWEEILLDGFETSGGMREQREDREYTEPVTVEHRGLSEHLADQVALLDLSPRQIVLAEEFIGNIDDDGYLKAALDAIISGVNDMLQRA